MLPSMGLRNLVRRTNALSSSRLLVHSKRNIAVSSISFLKQINIAEEGDKIIIDASYVPSPREKFVIKELVVGGTPSDFISQNDACACCLCKLKLQIKHTDVLIISQFINSKGKLLPRKVTGLCKEQDKRVDYLLVMAEKAGLIEVHTESGVRHLTGWERFNKYYDESVIEEFIYGRRKKH